MELEIVHNSTYTYDEPVLLDPHFLNFKPLCRPYITLRNFKLHIKPEPSKITERLDAEDNWYNHIWMRDEHTRELAIEAQILLEARPFNPFDFLLPADAVPSKKTLYYTEKRAEFLQTFLKHQSYPEVKAFVQAAIEKSEDKMVPFLTILIQQIYEEWAHEKQEYSRKLNARQCFENKRGSCKDLAWMLIVMLRGVGLATRFVSGYAYSPDLEFGHELHAWVEVLLPGAGWVGLDPSSGLFANEYYIPVATSFNPALTMPVDGTYRGNCSSKLESSVNITIID